MRKAKITGCVVEPVGTEMTDAAIDITFKVGIYERYAHVVFPIEVAKTYIDRNINQKSKLLTEHLMKYARKELEDWNEGDADTTDLENILRLKMPFLLRKAVNMEYFTQTFKLNERIKRDFQQIRKSYPPQLLHTGGGGWRVDKQERRAGDYHQPAVSF